MNQEMLTEKVVRGDPDPGESCPMFIYRTAGNLEEGLLFADSGCEALTGVRPEVLQSGQTRLAELIHPDDRTRLQSAIRHTLETGSPHRTVYRLRLGGETIRVLDHGVLIEGPSGRLLEGCVIRIDEKASMVRELEIQADKMRAVADATDKLAHDFNNILAVVISNLDLLMRRLAPEDRSYRCVERAMAAAARGSQENEHLLAFARKRRLRSEPGELQALVRNFLDQQELRLGEKQVQLATEFDEAPHWVCLDPDDLAASLLHLVENSVDALPHGGEIRFRICEAALPGGDGDENHDRPRWTLLEIEDQGMGMTPEVLSRCLEPFFGTKATHRRCGLGLSAVYGFARRSEGHLIVDSSPGQGTSVRIYLPRIPTPADSEIPS